MAFSAIAILVGFALLMFLYLMGEVKNDAKIINISGRQRMLSQKITKLCIQIAHKPDSLIYKSETGELKKTVKLFETLHYGLINGSLGEEINNSDTITKLFTGLQVNFETIVTKAEKFANTEENKQDDLELILKSEKIFLSLMNKIVFQYEKESNNKMRVLSFTMQVVVIFILVILFLELKFVMIPAINREEKNYNTIKENNCRIQEQNEELITTEEELRQNNKELFVLKKKAEKQKNIIEKKEGRLRHIIENQGEGFVILDLEGRFTFANPATEDIFDIPTVELIGKNLSDFFSEKEFDKMLQQCEYEEIGVKSSYELIATSAKNIKRHLSIISTDDINEENNITGQIWVLRDITFQVIAEKKLKNLNDHLLKSYNTTQEQKQIIEKAHNDITNSINYAQTIQQALLTSKELINTYFNDYFLFFKSKETVSGDFYYINKLGPHIVFAVADCTGHGVPGGFLTMLGITYTHEIVRNNDVNNTGEILNVLRQRIKNTFRTFGTNNKNGFDIAFCSVNTETNILSYAGAYNPLWIIRDNELLEHKATRNPIGFYPKEVDFKGNKVQLYDNDVIYIFSDGYQDQVGGEKNRKFTKKQLKEMFLKIHKTPMALQEEIVKETLHKWKNNNKQIDDITILGIKWKV
ncbi:MAG: hypothetical protein B6I20_11325 [Bacteroidetes bacterium 4572_117]|nr:MAG: hypothetical protein B6I20_11325 [Bacteroidetes bacterium 4572_117]